MQGSQGVPHVRKQSWPQGSRLPQSDTQLAQLSVNELLDLHESHILSYSILIPYTCYDHITVPESTTQNNEET